MRWLASIVVVAFLLWHQPNAFAYNLATHFDISKAAVGRSVLASDVLGNLGLSTLDQQFLSTSGASLTNFTDQCRHGDQFSITDLIACGSEFEDAPGTRSFNHFYDPTNNGPLTVCVPPIGGVALGITSPDWALQDNNATEDQLFSYKNARVNFFNALTTPGPASARDSNWGKLFQTLGQVIHHLQDMAQPQHVRNDQHVDLPIPGYFNPSLFESYTSDPANRPTIQALLSAAGSDPVYSTNNPNEFRLPRDFWKNTDGTGIAEFTNQNFVSAGTNFQLYQGQQVDVTRYSLPRPGNPTNKSVQELSPPVSQDILSYCGSSPICTMTFYSTNDGTAAANPRASALSIFDQYLQLASATYAVNGDCSGLTYQIDRVFALNRYTFDATLPLLMPRAVAYSAGLINYFFRGQMRISLPDEGVYGIVDHTVPAGNDPQTGGFGTIKLKLQNVTPGNDAQGNPVIEPVTEGAAPRLFAVAKFHRNSCYAADLSGEYGSFNADGTPRVNWQNWHPNPQDGCGRAPVEEIVVSEPVPVPTGINDGPQSVSFTFPNKIPISATDLYLQVVYRGQLGQEQDAVVVATKDISEPTYLNFYGARWDQSLYCSYGEIPGDPPACQATYTFKEAFCDQARPELTYDQCKASEGFTAKFRTNPISNPLPGYESVDPFVPPGQWRPLSYETPFSPVAVLPTPVGTITRVAYLTDLSPPDPLLWVEEWGVGANAANLFSWGSPFPVAATVNQVDPVTQNMVTSVHYANARGVFVPTTPYPWDPMVTDYSMLTWGDDPDVALLVPVPSQINF